MILVLLGLTSCGGGSAVLLPEHLARMAAPTLPPSRVIPFATNAFLDARQCWVYLPPGYALSEASYPTLYVLDGQDLFDPNGWDLTPSIDTLISTGALPPFILVAIAAAPSVQRVYEYTPFLDPLSANPTGGGPAFARALITTLKPAIDQYFRTRTSSSNTSIVGASLGGLLALYVAYAHPNVFRNAGAMSGAFNYDNGLFYYYLIDTAPAPLCHIYIDTGTVSDNLAACRYTRDILLNKGFHLGHDLTYIEAVGANHTPHAWATRFPTLVTTLLHLGVPSCDTMPLP